MPEHTLGISFGVSHEARLFVLVIGIALCGWTFSRLGKRSLLLSMGSILIAVGVGLICFASFPSLFDRGAYALGIKYPPLLYLIILLLCLSGMLLHLASRISLLDTRCRRLTQELAFLQHQAQKENQLSEADRTDYKPAGV